jgi:F-type H+-transporting ATPase subunit b
MLASTHIFLIPNGTFIEELVTFLIVLGVFAKYILPYLNKMLNEREAHIRNSIEAAEEARRAAEAAVAERRQLLETARQESRSIVDRANEMAAELREEARRRGQEEYERLLGAARSDIEQERRRAQEEVMEDVGDLVLRAAERVIGAALDAEGHRTLVEEAISAAQASGRDGNGAGGH